MRQFLDESTEIHVYKEGIDMRKSYDGLFKLVKNSALFDGGVFLFFSKNRKRAKVLLWNKNGIMIIMQRMEHGRFADLRRRTHITRDEFLDFFEGSKIVNKFDKNPNFSLEKSKFLGYKPVFSGVTS